MTQMHDGLTTTVNIKISMDRSSTCWWRYATYRCYKQGTTEGGSTTMESTGMLPGKSL